MNKELRCNICGKQIKGGCYNPPSGPYCVECWENGINVNNKKVHEMHTHPITEEREHIQKDKVLVDAEFKSLFTHIFPWYDNTHIVVYRKDFEELKTKYSSNSKNKKLT